MHNSKEDLIEMRELTSPAKKPYRRKLKKRNQVNSPPFTSPERSAEKDVTALFSVKAASRKSSREEDSETISEFSDDLMSQHKGSSVKSSRIRITRSSEKFGKLKRSLDKIRRESGKVDASIQSLRSRFELKPKSSESPESFFFRYHNTTLSDDDNESNLDDSGSKLTVKYQLAENLRFNINLSEKDNIVIFKRPADAVRKNIISSSSVMPRSLRPSNVNIQPGDCIRYHPPNHLPDETVQEVVVVKNNILELALLHLKFLHHPLFSLEHVLQQKLQQLFQKYSKTVEENRVEAIKEELVALRDNNSSVKDRRKLRQTLFKEGKLERDGLKAVLGMWKAIKKLRSDQKYSSTTVRLIIRKEESDVAMEKVKYNQFFEEMLQDLMEERKRAHKRKLKRHKRVNKTDDSEEEVISNFEESQFDLDKEKLQSELRAKFEESFRPPEEPRLTIYLMNDHQVTTDVAHNDLERDRRRVTLTTKFSTKILCQNVLVCKTKTVNLNDSFLLYMDEMVSIQLRDVPRYLSLEIFEHPKGLLKKRIAELVIEIPSDSVLYCKAKNAEVSFERKEIVHYKHGGVGSGCSVKEMLKELEVPLDVKLDPCELHTKGTLTFRVGWQSSRLKEAFSSDESLVAPSRVIDKWGILNRAQLQNWLHKIAEQSRFEESICDIDADEHSDYFRLSPQAGKFTFCKMDDILRNIRLQYLKLRDQNELEFDGMPIPNRIREIPFALLKDFKKRKALEAIRDDDEFEDDDPDALRESGKRRLKQMQTRIFHVCKGLDNNLSYESVVDEKYLIYFEDVIKTALKNCLNWFRWRPQLSRPLPRISISEAPHDESNATPVAQNKILIKVLAGKNVPERDDDKPVQAFLEIGYEDFSVKTSAASGGEPVWNEFVELPLQRRHVDYLNPDALNGSITINLFDDISNERKFWLGEVKVPLAALTTGLNLCGWFRVAKPSILLGYDAPVEQPVISRSPKRVNQEASAEATYVQLDLSVSPTIPLLEPNMAELPSNDVPYIWDHILKWNDIFNSSFPSRKFNALVIDTKGRTHCITRYIRALEPPQLHNEDYEVTPEQCLRYVSLIPFTECNRFYQNICLTSEQLLSFMIGSVVDHCVTLTCFLLAMKLDAYLLLGYGLPHGSTSYVLICEYTRESDLPNYFILDVTYNEKYSIADPFSPLQRVYCLVNGENVWGNAQRTPHPAALNFDLSRSSDWWPLFDDKTTAPTNFVNNKVSFARKSDFDDLETQLERKLKRKFSKWRPMERTNFNHKVSELFKTNLRTFETNAIQGRNNTEAFIDVRKVTAQYKINGIVLNIPFTSIQSIVRKIKTCNLQVQQQDVTEFGLSVFVQCYPGQVLSVWIFIGTVLEKIS